MTSFCHHIRAAEAPHEVLGQLPISYEYAVKAPVYVKYVKYVIADGRSQFALCVPRADWPKLKEELGA